MISPKAYLGRVRQNSDTMCQLNYSQVVGDNPERAIFRQPGSPAGMLSGGARTTERDSAMADVGERSGCYVKLPRCFAQLLRELAGVMQYSALHYRVDLRNIVNIGKRIPI